MMLPAVLVLLIPSAIGAHVNARSFRDLLVKRVAIPAANVFKGAILISSTSIVPVSAKEASQISPEITTYAFLDLKIANYTV
jgi:hypothetical protein